MKTSHKILQLGNGAMCRDCEWTYIPIGPHKRSERINNSVEQHKQDSEEERPLYFVYKPNEIDREPQPTDGPEYPADHQAWVERHNKD